MKILNEVGNHRGAEYFGELLIDMMAYIGTPDL